MKRMSILSVVSLILLNLILTENYLKAVDLNFCSDELINTIEDEDIIINSDSGDNPKRRINKVKVTQVYRDSFYNEEISVVIYNGLDDCIEKLVDIIENAETIPLFLAIKEYVSEGHFYIELFSGNERILYYEVVNSQNAYDMYTGELKKIQDIRAVIPNIIGNGTYLHFKDETPREDFYVNVSEAVLKAIFVNGIKNVINFVYTEQTSFIEKPVKKNLSDYLSDAEYGKEIKIVETIKKDKVIYLFFIMNDGEWICFSSLER